MIVLILSDSLKTVGVYSGQDCRCTAEEKNSEIAFKSYPHFKVQLKCCHPETFSYPPLVLPSLFSRRCLCLLYDIHGTLVYKQDCPPLISRSPLLDYKWLEISVFSVVDLLASGIIPCFIYVHLEWVIS